MRAKVDGGVKPHAVAAYVDAAWASSMMISTDERDVLRPATSG